MGGEKARERLCPFGVSYFIYAAGYKTKENFNYSPITSWIKAGHLRLQMAAYSFYNS